MGVKSSQAVSNPFLRVFHFAFFREGKIDCMVWACGWFDCKISRLDMPVHGVDITVLENIRVDTAKKDMTEIYRWKMQYELKI